VGNGSTCPLWIDTGPRGELSPPERLRDRLTDEDTHRDPADQGRWHATRNTPTKIGVSDIYDGRANHSVRTRRAVGIYVREASAGWTRRGRSIVGDRWVVAAVSEVNLGNHRFSQIARNTRRAPRPTGPRLEVARRCRDLGQGTYEAAGSRYFT